MNSIAFALIDPITDLIGKFIPDADNKAKLAHEIATMAGNQAHEQMLAQIEVNNTEAAHKSLFVAGWRPGLGWVGVIALFNNYVLSPYATAFGLDMPALDFSVMMPVILGMLGLTGARSLEKVKGVARER